MTRAGFYTTHSDGMKVFTTTSGYQNRETPPEDDTDSVLTFNDPWEDLSALEFHCDEVAKTICYYWGSTRSPYLLFLLRYYLHKLSRQDRIKDESDLAEEVEFLADMAMELAKGEME